MIRAKRKKPDTLTLGQQIISTQFNIFRTQLPDSKQSQNRSFSDSDDDGPFTPTSTENSTQKQQFLDWSPSSEQLKRYDSVTRPPNEPETKTLTLTPSTKRDFSETTPTLKRYGASRLSKLSRGSTSPLINVYESGSKDSAKTLTPDTGAPDSSTSFDLSEADSFELPSDCESTSTERFLRKIKIFTSLCNWI